MSSFVIGLIFSKSGFDMVVTRGMGGIGWDAFANWLRLLLQGGWGADAMGLLNYYYTKSGMGLWGMGRGCGVGVQGGWDPINVIYYNIDTGEGYFPAMETMHKRKQYNFRRTISQFL